jgi:hypothetical protein
MGKKSKQWSCRVKPLIAEHDVPSADKLGLSWEVLSAHRRMRKQTGSIYVYKLIITK